MQNNSFSSVIIWRSIQGVGQQGLQFVISIILARLLFPEDFGKIAVLTIFFAIANTLIDSGLGVSLVREKTIKQIDYDTVFTFNLVISILFYIIIFFSAPYIANFYHDTDLVLLTRVVGIKILIGSLSIVNFAKLRRVLNLKAIAIVSMASMLFGGIFAIIFAVLGYGVWAIVFQQLIMSSTIFTGYFIYAKNKIRIRFSFSSFKKLFSFGGYLLLATIIKRVSDNIYSMLIGKYYSMADVGYFTRANSLQNLPLTTINRSITEGAAPKLYQFQNEIESLMEHSRKIFRLINFLTFPLIASMFLFSKEIVILLLTVKWIAIVPFFKIFLIASILYSHDYFTKLILKAIGKSKLLFKIELITKILLILFIIAAIKISIIALAWCFVLLGVTMLLINMYYLNRTVSYNYLNLFEDVKYPALTSILMLLVLLVLNKVINIESLFFDLSLKLTIGFIFYLIINMLLKNNTSIMLKEKIYNYFNEVV